MGNAVASVYKPLANYPNKIILMHVMQELYFETNHNDITRQIMKAMGLCPKSLDSIWSTKLYTQP